MSVNIASILAKWHTNHDIHKAGYELFEIDSRGVFEIEAVAESPIYNDDDMAATKAVIEAADRGDPAALRILVILMARIAEPVIAAALKDPERDWYQSDKPMQVVIDPVVAETARRAVADSPPAEKPT